MSTPVPAPSPDLSAINLRRLLALRNIAIAGQTMALLTAVWGLGMALPVGPLVGVIVALALLNVATRLRLRRPGRVRDPELFGQLVADAAALTVALYFSGGSTNPFVLLYLLPLTITAATLPGAYSWAMAVLTAACYTFLMLRYVPLPVATADHASEFALHVVGMWLGFVLCAGLIAYFVVRMGETLRSRDRLLAAMRENELRNERILALGTLAAGAAHELGTPLSTIAVLVRDLEQDAPAEGDTGERLRILRDQVRRCKEILSRLSATAGSARAEAAGSVQLDSYLDELLGRWRALRPMIPVQARWQGSRPGPMIVADQTLGQAIMNVLNNAADASPQSVEVEGGWNERELYLEVRDRGPGIAPEVQTHIGRAFFTTKTHGQGLGLGLFLAQATIHRLGGNVRLCNRPGGGACTRLTLPLVSLLVSAA